MVTIKDIARALDVSATTVSRALRDRPGMRRKTRQLIKDTAKRLGYVPNLAGAALSTGRMRTIIYVAPNTRGRFPSLFTMDVLEGLVDEVSTHGYSVTIVSEQDLGKRGASVFDAFKTFRADGGVLLLVRTKEPKIKNPYLPFPVVIVNKVLDGLTADFVVADDEHGAYLATKHLIENGHREIAHVAGLPDNFSALRRVRGYQAALREHGLAERPELIAIAAHTRQGGYNAVMKLLDKGVRFTGLFCCVDVAAFGACRALRDRGLDVPADVSVVGFDDDSFAEYIEPPLTTIRKPRYAMGKMAGKLLVQRIEGRQARDSVTVTMRTRLIRRRSAALRHNRAVLVPAAN